MPTGYWIGSIKTDSPSEDYCLVMHGRTMTWDPHGTDDPSEMDYGPDPEFVGMTVFTYLDPAKHRA